MLNIIRHPLFVLPVSFLLMWLSAQVGSFLRKRQLKIDEDLHQDHAVIVSATLTLLALIIGFSFSMAIGRYDQRKNYEEAEANAIGTEYVRADLLPTDNATKVRALLKEYLDARILFYRIGDNQELQQVNARTAQLQSDLWSAVKNPANISANTGYCLGCRRHERCPKFTGIYSSRVVEPYPNRCMDSNDSDCDLGQSAGRLHYPPHASGTPGDDFTSHYSRCFFSYRGY